MKDDEGAKKRMRGVSLTYSSSFCRSERRLDMSLLAVSNRPLCSRFSGADLRRYETRKTKERILDYYVLALQSRLLSM